jgi:hypothetical protein
MVKEKSLPKKYKNIKFIKIKIYKNKNINIKVRIKILY